MVDRSQMDEESTFCGFSSLKSSQAQASSGFQRLKEWFRMHFNRLKDRSSQQRVPSLVGGSNKILLWWFLGSAVSIFLPLIIFGAARIQVNKRNQDDQDGNAQRREEEEEGDDGDYNSCRWWQWGCNSNSNNQEENRNEDNNERMTPWWWFFADEETRRQREESQSGNPALVFTYVWSLALFCAILYFGYREIQNGSDLYRVVASLAVFANFTFLTMFLIGGLEGVETEGRELEEQGFYSQFPVMMLLSYFCWTIFAGIFAVVFLVQARKSGVTKIDFETTDYQIHDAEPHLLENKPYIKKEPVSA